MNNEPRRDDDALDIDDFSDLDAAAIAEQETPERKPRKTRRPPRRLKLKRKAVEGGTRGRGPVNKLTYVLVALLAAAIVIIVWQAGRGTPMATEMPAGHPDVSQMDTANVPELDADKVAELKAVLEDSPNDVEALKELGKLYFDSLHYQDASEYFTKAAQLAPDDIEVHLMAGVTEFNLNNFDPAEKYWKRATEIDPNKAEPWYNLGFIYLMRDPVDTENLNLVWDKVLELAPDSDMAETVRGYQSEHGNAPSPTTEPAG
ncbi:MAG: tetratricopeptide repeat protein [Actinomycetaceae bacterium]|nr:tetratricopeptide repeat protein [Actinomycetaceae bacterium]